MLRLVRAFHRHAEVVGLFLGKLGELDADFFQVQPDGKSDVARPEITDDPLWRTDTNLNMVEFAESRRRIQLPPFHKKAANGIEFWFVFHPAKLMQRFNYRTIKVTGTQIRPAIFRHCHSGNFAELGVGGMSFLHLFQRLRIGEIETVTEVNDRAEHGRIFNLAAGLPAFSFGPTLRTFIAVLPEIDAMTKPVPCILTWPEVVFVRNDLFCDTPVASVIPDDQ